MLFRSLSEISVSEETSAGVYGNGQLLTRWDNVCIIPEIVDVLAAIDEDVEKGLARFEDGRFVYAEDGEDGE